MNIQNNKTSGINFTEFPDRERARFINSLSGFKSSNLIGTIDNKGNTNLSIISSAFHLGANPALLGFIIRPDSAPRDTLDNLRQSKICTLNHVNKNIVEQAHQTSARYPKDLSEFDACGLTAEYINDFEAPFVKESNIKMALKLIREEKLPENGCQLIITQITDVYIPKDLLKEDGRVDISNAGTVCVAGLDTYYEAKRLNRFSYAKPGLTLKPMED
jgi:flavin reductase (DIM6/NTAB) family NADH-FMN oxidoreductase RutF